MAFQGLGGRLIRINRMMTIMHLFFISANCEYAAAGL